jgi:transposase
MTKAQVEVITSVERRRRWSRAEKERIVAAALEPGAVASEVARAAGIHSSQLFRWRRQLCERAAMPVRFNPVTVATELGPAFPGGSEENAGTIEVAFADGRRLRMIGPVDAATVRAVLAALNKARRGRR